MKNTATRLASVLALASLSALLAFSACTKQGDSVPKADTPANTATQPADIAPAAPPQTNATTTAAASNQKADAELTIGTDGDNLAFDKTELTAKAGSVLKLIFKSNVKTSGMSHNWVLVKAGSEADVTQAGLAAGDEGSWVPSGNANVVVNTILVKPGESTTISFTVPAAGNYPYICTYPGHSATMKGVLHSK